MSKYAHNVVSEADNNTPWFKIMSWISDGQDVLDVGCSSGYFGEKLIEAKNSTVWGIDLDEADAKAAKKRGYQKVLIGDLDNFKWSQLGTLRFDSIIFADVLEHVKDPLNVVKQVSKFLKPGGFIFVSIPNVSHITVRTELMEGNFDYEDTGLLDNTHIRFFTQKTVKKLFFDAGMEIVHIDATTNDVSDGQIRNHMKKLGLEPTKKFDDLLHSTGARTFQHIVGARLATKAQKITPPEELSLPSKLQDDWPQIEKKMQQDDDDNRKLRAENEKLRQELGELNSKIDAIRKNPVRWAAKKAYRKIKNRT